MFVKGTNATILSSRDNLRVFPNYATAGERIASGIQRGYPEDAFNSDGSFNSHQMLVWLEVK